MNKMTKKINGWKLKWINGYKMNERIVKRKSKWIDRLKTK